MRFSAFRLPLPAPPDVSLSQGSSERIPARGGGTELGAFSAGAQREPLRTERRQRCPRAGLRPLLRERGSFGSGQETSPTLSPIVPSREARPRTEAPRGTPASHLPRTGELRGRAARAPRDEALRPVPDKGSARSPAPRSLAHSPPGVGVGHRRGAAAEKRGGERQPRPRHGGLRAAAALGQPPRRRPPTRGALRRRRRRRSAEPYAGVCVRRGAASAAPGPRPPHRPSPGRAPPAPDGGGEPPPPPPPSSPPSSPRSFGALFEGSPPAPAPVVRPCPPDGPVPAAPRRQVCGSRRGASKRRARPAAFVMRGPVRKCSPSPPPPRNGLQTRPRAGGGSEALRAGPAPAPGGFMGRTTGAGSGVGER